MSKIGKQPIHIPEGIEAKIESNEIVVAHKNGTMKFPLLQGVCAAIENKEIIFTIKKNNKVARTNWGTMRALVANAVQGFEKGFEKTLVLEGVGFKAVKEGNTIVLNIGFSHQVRYTIPETIICEIEKNTIKIKGYDKAVIGHIAAEIRALKKPEPYKGTGFRYKDEIIKKKAGKKAGATS